MQQLQRFWRLIAPFWLYHPKRLSALFLLIVVIGLSLSSVWFSVRLNRWNGAFFNAIQKMDADTIYRLLGQFILIVSVFVCVLVYTDWLQKKLMIEWRQAMTEEYLSRWFDKRHRHYRITLLGQRVENPDQRIAEDIAILIESSLRLVISFLRSFVTIVSFVSILWGLSGSLDLGFIGLDGVALPGYMVWVCFAYTLCATGLTHWIGKPLMRLNFEQQKREATFRSALILRQEHAEAIAGIRGERKEKQELASLFTHIQRNWRSLMDKSRNLAFFTVGFGQVTQLAPIFFALPKFLSGAIQLGGLMQIRIAFQQVSTAVGWFIYSYSEIARWSATVDRLTGFVTMLDASLDSRVEKHKQSVGISAQLSTQTPEGRRLGSAVVMDIVAGEIVAIRGRSGLGKSTLLRTIAGFWPYAKGNMSVPEDIYFVPQRLWFARSNLATVLSYPHSANRYRKQDFERVLKLVGLRHLIPMLRQTQTHTWRHRLSAGEQQRLRFARIFLHRPKMILLDRTTSALDTRNIRRIFSHLRDELSDAAILIVSHQPRVHNLVDRVLSL